MNEIELTFLAKYIPKELISSKFIEIEDWYFPLQHPRLRLRREGDEFYLARKSMLKIGDASQHKEEVIVLDKHHWEVLRSLNGVGLRKRRYFYAYKNYTAEVDVFEGKLAGLVLVDFEFEDEEGMKAFEMPDFCLVDVTQEDLIRGGYLSGKNYRDIEKELGKLGYDRVLLSSNPT